MQQSLTDTPSEDTMKALSLMGMALLSISSLAQAQSTPIEQWKLNIKKCKKHISASNHEFRSNLSIYPTTTARLFFSPARG